MASPDAVEPELEENFPLFFLPVHSIDLTGSLGSCTKQGEEMG